MQDLEFNLHANWNDDSLYSNAPENESFENDEILLARILPLKKRTMTLWEDFSRKPNRSIFEKFICVLKGREKFRMISPAYRPNILVNNIEQMQENESPLDFFNEAHLNMTLTKDAQFLDAEVQAGDCIYVPAYFYIQSQTLCSGTDD